MTFHAEKRMPRVYVGIVYFASTELFFDFKRLLHFCSHRINENSFIGIVIHHLPIKISETSSNNRIRYQRQRQWRFSYSWLRHRILMNANPNSALRCETWILSSLKRYKHCGGASYLVSSGIISPGNCVYSRPELIVRQDIRFVAGRAGAAV